MKPKTILNGAILFIGLGLAAYSQLNGYRLRFNVESVRRMATIRELKGHIDLKELSILADGETIELN